MCRECYLVTTDKEHRILRSLLIDITRKTKMKWPYSKGKLQGKRFLITSCKIVVKNILFNIVNVSQYASLLIRTSSGYFMLCLSICALKNLINTFMNLTAFTKAHMYTIDYLKHSR